MQNDGGGLVAAGGFLFGSLIGLILIVAIIIGMWKLFEKAGKAGWASIIPFYNFWVMGEIIYGPSGAWKPLLAFLPVIGWIFSLICMFRLAQVFGKDVVFCILTLLFPYVCLPLIGFGSDSYNGPVSSVF